MTATMNIRQTAQSIGVAVIMLLLRCYFWIINILWHIIKEIISGVFRIAINMIVIILFTIAFIGFLLWLFTI